MRSAKARAARIVLYLTIVLFAIVYLVPIYMTGITALKPPAEINLQTAWQAPSRPHWQSFVDAWERLGPFMTNSVVLTISGTVISAVLGSMNGYVFSKWRFRGSELIFTLILFGMFIPYQIILIPLFQTLRAMGMYGGIPGLVLAHVVYGIPITTLIFRNTYAQISPALTDISRIDGAGFFRTFLYVMLPLSAPGFVVVVIWQFTQIWNEFLWGITLTQQDANPITVGLAQLAGGQAVNWNLPMAGSIVAAGPVVLLFVFLGRYFIRGLLAGSVKE